MSDAITTEGRVCKWTEDFEGVWSTECGEMHTIIEGSPADNKMIFCCYCGGKMAQCSYQEVLNHG